MIYRENRTFFDGEKRIAFSGSIQAQGVDCSRIEIRTSVGNDISVINGDQGWIREDQTTRAMTKKELAEAQEEIYSDWVSTLVPIRGADFTLTRLDAAKAGNREIIGLRVSRKARRDVDLYFDCETWLLVKKRITRIGPQGNEMEYVTVLEDFREFDQVKLSTKWVTHPDGQIRFEGEVVDARFVERLPANTFTKP